MTLFWTQRALVQIPPSLGRALNNTTRQSVPIQQQAPPNMKTILAAAALFLPAALAATDTIFGSIPEPCGPCLHQLVANGPGSVESKEFANYLCMGEGGSDFLRCMTECGKKSPSDSVLDIDFTEGQNFLIIRVIFDYWYALPANGVESNLTPNPIK